MTDAAAAPAASAETLGALVEDYARDSVPQTATIGIVRIAMILIGTTIALPAFVLGAELGAGLGFGRMVFVCFAGGLVLAGLAVPSAYAGARARLSTYLLVVAAFGRSGGRLANAVIGLSLLGWFGVIAMMFGRSAAQIAGAAGSRAAVLGWAAGGAAIMIVSAIVGFRALDRLSSVLTPVKAILLVTTAGAALHRYGSATLADMQGSGMPLGTGVTLVVGALAIGAIVQPDFCRYARTPVQAAIASGSVFALAFPLVLLLAGTPSIAMHETDIVTIMIALGLGIPAMLTVILAAWANNTYNLYAGSLVLATIFTHQPRWRLTLAVGLVGAALGLLGIGDAVVPYLVLLSIAIPPIGGVYLANFYLASHRGERLEPAGAWHAAALVAWLLGTGIAGLETWRHVALAGIPALDSLLIAAAAYLPLRWRETA
jgi:cytosine permease